MEHFAFVATEIGPDLAYATFYDPEAAYGFSLSLAGSEPALDNPIG